MILIKGAVCLDSDGSSSEDNVIVDGGKVAFRGKDIPDSCSPDRVIDGSGCILMPGFVNAHCHTPMTLLRGLGSDCPLDVWLNEHIFPAEDRLDGESAYIGTMCAIAEMIRSGVTSFSDMYFFCDKIADAVLESGMRANISRSIVSFDEGEVPSLNPRAAESIELFKNYNGSGGGRVKIDFSLHAEYTNTERMCRYIADLAKEYGAGIQIHLSETEKEHEECKKRRGMTPAAFFESCGVFDVPVSAAHAVWLEADDMEILSRHGVSVVHNPRSNLKLGSGIMDFIALSDAGVNIALGTDGSASNNKLDLMSEMQLAALIHKGVMRKADITPAKDVFYAATAAGIVSQGRVSSAGIREGMDADLILLSCDRAGLYPPEDPLLTVVYAADRSDVVMTMVDGQILWESGEYRTIDIEKIRSDFSAVRERLTGER